MKNIKILILSITSIIMIITNCASNLKRTEIRNLKFEHVDYENLINKIKEDESYRFDDDISGVNSIFKGKQLLRALKYSKSCHDNAILFKNKNIGKKDIEKMNESDVDNVLESSRTEMKKHCNQLEIIGSIYDDCCNFYDLYEKATFEWNDINSKLNSRKSAITFEKLNENLYSKPQYWLYCDVTNTGNVSPSVSKNLLKEFPLTAFESQNKCEEKAYIQNQITMQFGVACICQYILIKKEKFDLINSR
ncbi:hypothetical protein NUH30_19430 [Leptospira sp. 85282-16]|uniref:hypothetical protein n=1 Tax=Leptospira sp. 85282-16 TaxID=2971256 RepID=UPI0021C04BD7|nr:hypothetical protein [Leptospira sp. 85282-16]MCT8335868.1 hypothetical protein [Leptospira sp. 85282-16]